VNPSKYVFNKFNHTYLRTSWKNATSEIDKIIKDQELNTKQSMMKSP